MRLLLLLLLPLLSAARVDENSAGLVTELVTNALAREPALEVLSSADVRRQLELEADKQRLGCDVGASSCLAEIAGAMGAQLVVYGKLGELDDVVVLTLNLFDSTAGKAVGRVALREPGLNALAANIETAVAELVAPYVKDVPAGTTKKLLVLDVEAPKPAAAPAPPPAAAPPDPLFLGGAGAVGGGLVLAGVGAALYLLAGARDAEVKDLSIDAVRAEALYNERDALGVSAVVAAAAGGAVAVAGGVLLTLAVIE